MLPGLTFFRHATGRVVWKRPAVDINAEESVHSSPAPRTPACGLPRDGHEGSRDSPLSEQLLSSGWKRSLLSLCSRQRRDPCSLRVRAMPCDDMHVCNSCWGVRYESRSTGRVFYRNRNTGQTQWTHPGLASSSAYLYQATRSPLSMDERQDPCASRLYAGTPSIESLTSFPNLSEHLTPPANGNSTLAWDIESIDRSRSSSPRGSGNDSRGRSNTLHR